MDFGAGLTYTSIGVHASISHGLMSTDGYNLKLPITFTCSQLLCQNLTLNCLAQISVITVSKPVACSALPFKKK